MKYLLLFLLIPMSIYSQDEIEYVEIPVIHFKQILIDLNELYINRIKIENYKMQLIEYRSIMEKKKNIINLNEDRIRIRDEYINTLEKHTKIPFIDYLYIGGGGFIIGAITILLL